MNISNEDFEIMEKSAKLELDILKLLDQTDLELKYITLVLNKLIGTVIKKM